MKIFGGKFKGRNFYMPASIRPTQGMARQAIFDIIGHDLSGMEVLDLYAGSGALGLEAVSRGAKIVTFVEKDPKCLEVIQENLTLFGLNKGFQLENECQLIAGDVFPVIKILARGNRKFHLVFLDPPYNLDLVKKTLKRLVDYDILHPNSLVVVEHVREESPLDNNERLFLLKQGRYGKTYLTVFRYQELNPAKPSAVIRVKKDE